MLKNKTNWKKKLKNDKSRHWSIGDLSFETIQNRECFVSIYNLSHLIQSGKYDNILSSKEFQLNTFTVFFDDAYDLIMFILWKQTVQDVKWHISNVIKRTSDSIRLGWDLRGDMETPLFWHSIDFQP